MDLINREDLLKQFESGALLFQPSVREIIEAVPAIETVPVMRCKDCRWKYGSCCVRFAEVQVSAEDYCSRGEKKKG